MITVDGVSGNCLREGSSEGIVSVFYLQQITRDYCIIDSGVSLCEKAVTMGDPVNEEVFTLGGAVTYVLLWCFRLRFQC